MADTVQSITPIVRPRREFNYHASTVLAVAVFLDGSRMVTGSEDQTLCLWNLKDGAVLKRMKGHHNWVKALKISEDGKFIASGAGWGELMAWDGDTGEPLTEVIRAHTHGVSSVDLSPDSLLLATVSYDKTMKFWRTDTWDIQGAPINIGEGMHCVRYSPSGELLAIATDESIQIWNPQIPHVSNYTAKFEAMDNRCQTSLAWTPDGTRLFSAGDQSNPTIYEWDTSSWKQVGVPWSGHTKGICILAINSTGTLIASASYDKDVRLWQLSNRQTIAIFRHSDPVRCVTFSADDKYILSGGVDWKISEWDIPEGTFLEDTSKVSDVVFRCKEKLRNMSWKAALCDAQKVPHHLWSPNSTLLLTLDTI
ncbi:WD40 repeat-like protein [Rhizopogon salebrosus TDB-379]|nr:WD40 repeat-like protein [Rhizopogon salebrosus TDB-379]